MESRVVCLEVLAFPIILDCYSKNCPISFANFSLSRNPTPEIPTVEIHSFDLNLSKTIFFRVGVDDQRRQKIQNPKHGGKEEITNWRKRLKTMEGRGC